MDNLIEGYEKMKPEIDQALNKDLGYNSFMCNFGAHAITMNEVKDIRKSLSSWVKAEKVETPLGKFSFYEALGLASCQIEYEPLGLVMVISAWNYPIYTAIPQVAAAISAGNSVILKPS